MSLSRAAASATACLKAVTCAFASGAAVKSTAVISTRPRKIRLVEKVIADIEPPLLKSVRVRLLLTGPRLKLSIHIWPKPFGNSAGAARVPQNWHAHIALANFQQIYADNAGHDEKTPNQPWRTIRF